jgi:hypothetical protein
MPLTITLGAIREHDTESWRRIRRHIGHWGRGDDTTVPLVEILDQLGLDDALWALQALPSEMDGPVRLLACDFAAEALQHTADPRPAEAIAVARRYAAGEATAEELAAARTAAWDAATEAWDAARVAAWDAARVEAIAANVARAARATAWGAATAWDAATAWGAATAWDAARAARAAAAHAAARAAGIDACAATWHAAGANVRAVQEATFRTWLAQWDE